MNDCIFCKIVKGEIPCFKVYEDENTLAFLDISPANKGHVLVIPKKHYETVLEISEEEFCNLTKSLQKVSKKVFKNLNADGFNIVNNNKKVSGQIVPHIHFHIIPRFSDDELKINWRHLKYEENEAEEILKKINKD
ncbi:MAG: HIT family protein [Candidatus Woesearchaeota archaeon]